MNEKEFREKLAREVYWRTTRSGGKGGQHVNKTESRVELLFSVADSQALSSAQKELLLKRIEKRFPDKTIHIVSQAGRSQHGNKADALDKLVQLILKNLVVQKKRVNTGVPASVKRKRAEDKQKKSRLKQLRKKPGRDE